MGVLRETVLLKTFEERPQLDIAGLGAGKAGVTCVVTELHRVDRVHFHAEELHGRRKVSVGARGNDGTAQLVRRGWSAGDGTGVQNQKHYLKWKDS